MSVLGFDPGWVILVLLVALLLLGMPIAFVLGVTAAVMILLDPAVVPQIIGLIPFGGANNYLLVAALLFMIAGEVMNQGRIAEKLIAFASSLVGHIRGGLAHVNILTSLFFSEISGTATSDAAAIGSVMIPQMKKRGYPVAFAAAVTSTSATMAIIVPPSLNLILYAYVANASIAELFAAGIVPGFLVCGLLMGTAYGLAVRRGYPTEGAFSLGRVLSTGKDAAVPLTLPILVLVGILGGIFTATEAGAVAAFWSIVLAMLVYRTVRLGTLVDTLRVACRRSAMLMFIVATSTLLGWYLTNQRIPQDIAEGILGLSDSYWVVLLAINAFFLLGGHDHPRHARHPDAGADLPTAGRRAGHRPGAFRADPDDQPRHRPADAACGLRGADHLRHRQDLDRADRAVDDVVHRGDARGADAHQRLPGHRAVAALGHPVMRLLVVNPNISPGATARIRAVADAAARPGERVVTVPAAFGPELIVTEADTARGAQGVLAAVAEHGADVDGVVLASFGDTGAEALRRARPGLPVIGIAGAAFAAGARDGPALCHRHLRRAHGAGAAGEGRGAWGC